MAIISRITTQKKQTDRYNIYIDDNYAFSVDESVLIKFGLKKGLEVSPEFLEKLLLEDTYRKGYNWAINFLSYRMRSVKEVANYLKKKELQQAVVEKIVEKLKRDNYLNDLEFAKAFVQSRINLTLKGPGVIKQELIEKGLAEKEINESMELYSFEEELEKAIGLLRKKQPAKLKTSQREQDRKMYMLLVSKGFSHEVANMAFQHVKKERKVEDSEWEAIQIQGKKALHKYKGYNDWEKSQRLKQFLYRKGFSFELIDKYIEYYETQGE